ncbi:hypothetical protein MHYP_G00315380 [Metynnis hypsauchen]
MFRLASPPSCEVTFLLHKDEGGQEICSLLLSLPSEIFSITLPESVESVRGLCVFIPCTFTIESQFDTDLQGDPKGIWRKLGTEGYQTVFDSTTPKNNQIKGEIRGDLKMKNCTTIFNSVSKADSGRYYFRIESGELKYTYGKPSVSINVSDSPPKPTLSLYRDQMEVQDRRVLEGSSVSLFCSAFSLCPTQPPTLTWSPLPTNSSQEQTQNTSFISSQLSFITTHLHHDLRINCTATYQLKKVTKPTRRSVVLHVLYAPRNTSVSASPSGPVMLGRSVSLNCSSDGNPAVNYTWYRENGEQIETGPSLTITETDETHSGLYYCRAQNQHGAQNSSVQLDIQYAPRNTLVSASLSGPVMWGRSVSLNCSSDGNPAVKYSWYRDGQHIETGPSLTINKTDDTHSGLYCCRAQNQHGDQTSSVQLDIQYAPQVELLFHCNSSSEGGVVCVCEVHGHPVPKLEWRLSGQPVPPSENSPIREEFVGRTGLRSFISIHHSFGGDLHCIGTNRLGSTSKLFFSVATHHCSSAGHFHILSILVGAAAGASVVIIMCSVYLCRRRTYHKPAQEETTGLVLNDRAVCQDVQEGESVYANKNILTPNLDILHYSTIYFPNAGIGSGEIRGLSALTPEYATILHSSREDPKRETTEAENSSVTEEEQRKPEMMSGEEIQPTNEEATYGNIVHHKTPQSDLDAGVEIEQSETKPTDPEQLTDVDGAEGVYAQVEQQKPELGVRETNA